jgi:hypothetical protein
MQIRIRQTSAVMYEDEFRRLHFGLGLPHQLTEEIINAWGGDIVFEGPQATGGTVYQYSQASGVEQIDGKWYTKYILGPVFTDQVVDGVTTTAAEQEAAYKAMKDAEQAKSVRQARDDKLKETDWRYRRDQTTTPEWDAYCQALRDVPTQEGFPWTIVWPTQPGVTNE